MGGPALQEGGWRAAPPRERVGAPPVRARWVPRPRRLSTQPRARSRVWSAIPSSGSSARGRRRPAAARPAGRWMPGSPRPLSRGGELGLQSASLCPAASGPQPTPSPGCDLVAPHRAQTRSSGWTPGSRSWRCQRPAPEEGAPSEKSSEWVGLQRENLRGDSLGETVSGMRVGSHWGAAGRSAGVRVTPH